MRSLKISFNCFRPVAFVRLYSFFRRAVSYLHLSLLFALPSSGTFNYILHLVGNLPPSFQFGRPPFKSRGRKAWHFGRKERRIFLGGEDVGRLFERVLTWMVRRLRRTLLYADTLCPRLRTTPERSQLLQHRSGSFTDRKTTRAVLI